MNATLKNLLLWAAIFVMVILIFNLFNQGAARRGAIIYSDFFDDVGRAAWKRSRSTRTAG